ncbi:MAG: SDR family NAD(P)-dependent oxidoreductase [Hormoscilla sp. GM7CHS1pb]|nr:SDR family NAD(P)-dependent oxidoreductase [Hormoscilla sp. GM7CHS1pb]
MLRLKGKSAIVTGAGRGIGKAIAQKFLQEGARLLICDIVPDMIVVAAEELSQWGEVYRMTGDVSERAFCEALVKQAAEYFGEIDVLVNNAGIVAIEPFLEHSESAWDRVMAVNLKGTFLLGQQVARVLVAQGKGGAIINMGSTNGHVAERESAAYNASKAEVVLLTKTMAAELAPYNIRVNCVSPGFIITDLTKNQVLAILLCGNIPIRSHSVVLEILRRWRICLLFSPLMRHHLSSVSQSLLMGVNYLGRLTNGLV